MNALARIELLEARNRRSAPRRQLSLGSVLSGTGEKTVIHDLSVTGILIETKAVLATFEQLQLDLPEVGETVATVLWNSGHYYGCEFHAPIPQAAISAALLRSPFAQIEQLAPLQVEEDDAEESDVADDRYSLGVRLRVILGTSLALWALIMWGAAVL